MTARGDWIGYYDAQGERQPRDLLLRAIASFEREGRTGTAVDLGCGTGADTAELIARGWDVTAIDGQEEAIRRLREEVDPRTVSRLRTVVSEMEEATFPPADLVFASYSLPFCRPDAFPTLWERLRSCLRPGGRFAGELFGDRDSWSSDPGMTFHDVAAARVLFDGLDIEVFEEEEEDAEGWDELKHWHVLHTIARKPDRR
ncbi:MAG: class I SAM-dependent methyltransferase [Actinobacteria bacterium]|nr:class I SAM-dependent methyltransferase [Actinomycetota bacterium]